MKIGIIGPKPVPHVQGGTENLLESWTQFINTKSMDKAELVRLDSLELSFWDLIETYQRFFTLDVSRFDLVISTKYPSWMIDHPNHRNYMIHTLRGLYDTYHCFHLPDLLPHFPPQLQPLMAILRAENFNRQLCQQVFTLLYQHKAVIDGAGLAIFPGPFIREIVHYLDRCGLQSAQKFTTMSATVRQRSAYFPPAVNVAVAYPPTSGSGYFCGQQSYFLAISRLDYAKRIDLTIRAFMKSSSTLPLLIAGTGPAERELKILAQGDARVQFIGFVDDSKLKDLYANAIAVIFNPLDEDYGLVTIEAMQSGKPVLTMRDSGGPVEFVSNGETGFVVKENDVDGLAKKISYVAQHLEEALKMGQLGRESVKDINWENFSRQVLPELQLKKKILVCSTYKAYPPMGGGQVRLFNIYKRLAQSFDVTLLVLSGVDCVYEERLLDNGLREISIPQSKEHAEMQWMLEKDVKAHLYDVAMIRYAKLTTRYVETLDTLAQQSDLVIFSHPYLYPVYNAKTPFIYEAHNIEYELKQSFIPNSKKGKILLEELRQVESEVAQQSIGVVVCSDEEQQKMIELYGIDKHKTEIIPNGVDTDKITWINAEKRKLNKRKIGISAETPVLVFLGSWHQPNLEAFEFILDLAKESPEYLYFIIGSVSDFYKQECKDFSCLPPNMKCFGALPEEVKNELMGCCDIGLNPIFSGAGTNLKLIEYLARGMQVVSTEFGARGNNLLNDNLKLADRANFLQCIEQSLINAKISPEGNSFVWLKEYGWSTLSNKFGNYITKVCK